MALRRNSTWTSRILACAVAFTAAAAAVYMLGKQSTPGAEGRYVARATVTCTLPSGETAREVAWPAGLDETALTDEILGDDNLRLVTGATGKGSEEVLDRLQRDLRISVREAGKSGYWAIDIIYQGADARRSAELVNRLAAQFCRARRSRVEQPARGAYVHARNAASAAQGRWVTAQSRLDALLEGHFQELSSDAKQLAECATGGVYPPSADAWQFQPAQPAPLRIERQSRQPVDNPEWLDLNAEIEKLMDVRARWLADRTPMHPDVQAVEGQIADLQGRLAKVPRKIEPQDIPVPQEAGTQPVPGGIPPLPPDDDQLDNPTVEPTPLVSQQMAPRAEAMVEAVESAARDFRREREAVRAAQQQFEQLAADARRAWAGQLAVPVFAVQAADGSEAVAAERTSTELPLVALVAGLAAALSTAMLMPGGGYPIFTNAGQVEQHLQIPVLGKVAGGQTAKSGVPSQSASAATGTLFQVVLVTLLLGGLAAAAAGYYFGW